MWEVECRKERTEKEKKELLSKRKNKEKEQAMYAAWGTSSDMYEEDVNDIVLMAIEESEPEPESDYEGMEEQVHSSCDDADDISLVQLVSKRLRSRLSIISCQPIALILPDAHESPTSNPLVKAPVQVTRSVQRTQDAMLLAKSTKKIRPLQSKFVVPSNPIEIDDDDIVEPKKSRKRKINTSKLEESGPKETDEIDFARALSFRRRSVIRGRVIIGFGVTR
ncbi:hypothetical protein H5410_028341 [Solanum commersonii]|uniref:Uncharacterized protein n=1 Tax=Solanum commersonii TaxID=4109 RepID=A0A9J5Z1T5_SOLCO|nr:hypothetical protein H5410_028341 [Solanum commersonii]